MSNSINRRQFLGNSLAVSTGAGILAQSFEEKHLLAQSTSASKVPGLQAAEGLPQGTIKGLNISRLICGGNLISGFAHSRDLIYVSPLLKQYFTDEKILDTLENAESNGINTAILRCDQKTVNILKKYREERGGTIQWIAQTYIKENDTKTNIRLAIDNGAVAAYTHGGIGDNFVRKGRVDLIGDAVAFIKDNGLPGGVAGHCIEVQKACEKDAIGADFYMKTFHKDDYWSATPKALRKPWDTGGKNYQDHTKHHDNIWVDDTEKTAAFMATVNKPWIAYKVLAAGAIHPSQGFTYAFANGADFICVGMFDFQITEDAIITKQALAGDLNRTRPWYA